MIQKFLISMGVDVDAFVHWMKNEALLYLGMICVALFIFGLGMWAAFLLKRRVNRLLMRRQVEPTIRGFLAQGVFIGIVILVLILTLSKLGIQTASIVAVIASASFAVALALQGSLSHVASGIVLVVLRPFKVGDYIEAAGVAGKVTAIEIMFTSLLTSDHRAVTIPNARIFSEIVINCSSEKVRRVEMPFLISYQTSIEPVRSLLLSSIGEMSGILKDPEMPTVWVKSFDDRGVTLLLRFWTSPTQLPNLQYLINERVKAIFDQAGIVMPLPQREVHLAQADSRNVQSFSRATL